MFVGENMKKTRILSLILAAVLLVTCSGCTVIENVFSTLLDSFSKPAPILYEVTDKDGDKIWLFGSIHIGSEDFYPLPDYVTDAFEQSEGLAVEANVVAFEQDYTAQSEALLIFAYGDGTTVSDHISEDVYEDAVEILEENNSYNFVMDYYNASLWANQIDNFLYQNIEADIKGGIDRHFINSAMESDKEILEIESAEFQYGMLSDFSEELQEYLLKGSIESYNNPDLVKTQLETMQNCWLYGREKLLLAMCIPQEFENDEEGKLLAEYSKKVITDRNIAMTDFAEQALENGDELFICVGAAHVLGEDAMADLLEERGYTVRKITK